MLQKQSIATTAKLWSLSWPIPKTPKYLVIVVNRFRYIDNNVTKDRCSIPMNMTVVLGLHKFSLEAPIDHHEPFIYSGHYTTSVKCCKNSLLQRQQNYGVWADRFQKLLYCICSNIQIDNIMVFGLQRIWGWGFHYSHVVSTYFPSR